MTILGGGNIPLGSTQSGEVLPLGPEFAVSGLGGARQVLAEGKGDINNDLKNINLFGL